jgi:hypothetical protein
MSTERRDVEAGGRRRTSRDALTSRPEIERLLDAASAPASPRELAGEHAAVDLFARARLVRPAAAAETSSRSPRAGLKAAAASVAAVVAMSSGVAFATTGHVPFAETLKQVTRQVTGQGSDDGTDGRTGGTHGRKTSDGESTGPNGPKAVALHGLCRAFVRGQKATHGHALETRPFTSLVQAAGGAEQVESFCAALPPKHDPATNPSHPTHPSHPAHPTVGPSGSPAPSEPGSTHPTKPVHPTKQTHPAEPTHEPKPSHSPKPTDNPSHTATPHSSHAAE